jgi:hypothetical protein
MVDCELQDKGNDDGSGGHQCCYHASFQFLLI